MPGRRLEDRIRELCTRVVYEKGAQWRATVQELQIAISEHSMRLANATAVATVIRQPQVIRERRRS